LLDIGCWNGYLLERIREAGLYQELYGVDIVPEGIETVRAKGFQAQVVDLNRDPLPFPDEYFDGVTLLAVLEHIFDPYAVIREVHRVLRPGGELVIDVPNVASFTNRIRHFIGTVAGYFYRSWLGWRASPLFHQTCAGQIPAERRI
jgi:SAM-dependent methyltransferase